MVPDAVIPIVVEESVVAILAVAGPAGKMDRDRPYASMLADLVANAFQISLAIEALEQRAMTDPLTGLYNRAYLADRFLVELRRARNYGFPMSVALFDIDRFKRINDRYGHLAGDAVLRELAFFLRERTRSTDAVVRYGGEEFAVLMATADSDAAFQHADRIRAGLEKTPFVVPGQAEPIQVTISGGVATYPQDGQTFSELIAVADAGLYRAKENGRNKITGPRQVELLPE
jgi:diguanylate cyclase (GGDEF)-like protein